MTANKAQLVRVAVTARVAAAWPASIAQVEREAGVSRKFNYSHPRLRADIEQRAT